MKTIQHLCLLAFCILSFHVNAHNNAFHYYVIQLASYSSTQAFEANKDVFNNDFGNLENQVFSETIGKKVNVYLLDKNNYFVGGEELQKTLAHVHTLAGFEQAFMRPAPDDYSKLERLDRLVHLETKPALPSEFSTKGTSDAAQYTIQLGAFGQMKSNIELARTFGFTTWELSHFDKVVHHDFTKVGSTICRRYYFGNFKDKAAAMKRLAEMEKASGQTLSLVNL